MQFPVILYTAVANGVIDPLAVPQSNEMDETHSGFKKKQMSNKL